MTHNLFQWCTVLINRCRHLAKSLVFTSLTLFPEQQDSRFSNTTFQSDMDPGIVLHFSWRWHVSLRGYSKICLPSEHLKRRFVHRNLLKKILLAFAEVNHIPLPLWFVKHCLLAVCVRFVFNLIIEHVPRMAPPYLYRYKVVAVLISLHRKKPKRFMTSGSREPHFRRTFSVVYRI